MARTHELQVPVTPGQMRGLLAQAADAADLENIEQIQAGCPVQILQASFERPAQLMLTSHDRDQRAVAAPRVSELQREGH